jgi:hypothetical protein
MLIEVVEALADTLAERASTGSTTPREQVHAHIDAWLATGPGSDPHAVACWAAIGVEAVHHAQVGEIYRTAIEQQIHLLAQSLHAAAPYRAPADARALAVVVHATIEGSFRLHTSAAGVVPEGCVAPTLRGLVDGWMEAR